MIIYLSPCIFLYQYYGVDEKLLHWSKNLAKATDDL